MKGLKKLIVAFISIIIILIIITIVLLKTNGNGDYTFVKKEIQESEDDQVYDDSIQIADYFSIKSCVQGYIDALDKTNSIYYETQENGEQKYNPTLQKKTLYSLLSGDYIKNNNITEDNIDKHIKIYNEKYRYYPIEIKNLRNDVVSTFKVSGMMQNIDYKNAQRVYCVVNIDSSNNSFSIQQLEEKEYEKYNKSNDVETTIKNNGYNVFNNSNIDVQAVSVEYLNLYKFLTLGDPQITYNMMTEEYRNKRFGSLDNYKQYIKDNYEELTGIYANKYLTNNTDKAVQYVVQDQYENLYIFDVKSSMDYTIKLDTYTLEEEKFNSTYAEATEDQKVQMNIGKFFDMINRHDYRTSYNCLAEDFKKNKFKNEKDFETTIKKDIFSFNRYKVKELNNVGANTYACKLDVSDNTLGYDDGIGMTIIMKLQQGTDFVMSYSMN